MSQNLFPIISFEEFPRFWNAWEQERMKESEAEIETAVKAILDNVRISGDAALIEYTERFDKVKPEKIMLDRKELEVAYENLRTRNYRLVEALEATKKNIARFAELQFAQLSNFKTVIAPGVVAGQRVIPVQRAGIYAPGGRYSLVSSVLMGAVPAKIAGVSEVIIASPPKKDGKPDSGILAAAYIAGADAVYVMGGAQAIGAMTYGTSSVPRVDVIAGPGNAYVAEAKRQVFGRVGIDLVAGPTDVLIVADESAFQKGEANLIALDMIAQAEHDPRASAIVLVPSMAEARQVLRGIDLEFERRDRGPKNCAEVKTAREALVRNGLIVLYKTMDDAVAIANIIAPEHLELHLVEAESLVPYFLNYGSLFIGARAGEVLGDYAAGINHTLPTGGSSRFASGLSVRTFLKCATTLVCSENAQMEELLETSQILANAEGLSGHASSAAARMRGVNEFCCDLME